MAQRYPRRIRRRHRGTPPAPRRRLKG